MANDVTNDSILIEPMTFQLGWFSHVAKCC